MVVFMASWLLLLPLLSAAVLLAVGHMAQRARWRENARISDFDKLYNGGQDVCVNVRFCLPQGYFDV